MAQYSDRSGNNPFGVNLAAADRSGSITVGGVAQVLAPATATRKVINGQNISAGDLWLSEGGTAAVDAVGSYKVIAGDTFSTTYNGAISIIGATTGQKFSAREE